MSINALIQQEKYNEAIAELENKLDTQENYQTLSLLYRLEDLYELEATLVKNALTQYPAWDYMREREAWHNIPIFDRVVPRPPYVGERDPKFIPKPETVERMCFVLGLDSNHIDIHMKFLIETIESIRNGRFYHEVPIFIIEKDWTDEHKQQLLDKFKDISFVPCLKYSEHPVPDNYHILENRVYFDHIFPDFDYYFWIDADVWNHDDRALDLFIKNAELYGLGIARQLDQMVTAEHHDVTSLTQEHVQLCLEKNTPVVNAGISCIRKDMVALWRNIFLNNAKEKPINFWTDQACLFVLIAQRDIPLLHKRNNCCICYLDLRDFAYIKGNPHVFFEKGTDFPLGFIHNWGNCKYANLHCADIFDEVTDMRKMVSLRFRVWPWQDKPEIKAQLLKGS